MERLIVKPESVRCLGNILSPKSLSDWSSNGTLTTSTDTVGGQSMTVYELGG